MKANNITYLLLALLFTITGCANNSLYTTNNENHDTHEAIYQGKTVCYSKSSNTTHAYIKELYNGSITQDSVIVIDEIIEDEALLFATYETPAEFPGGMKALMQFIKDNQHYPDECLQLGIEGRSIIRFIITEEGDVDRIELIRSSGNTLLDEEALRIVRIMPRWTPMMMCYPTEHAVRSWWTLPIKFELPQETKNNNILGK